MQGPPSERIEGSRFVYFPASWCCPLFSPYYCFCCSRSLKFHSYEIQYFGVPVPGRPANLAPNQHVPPANTNNPSSRNASPRISLKCLSTFIRRLVGPNLSTISIMITKSVWLIIRSQLRLAVPLEVDRRIGHNLLQMQLRIPPRGDIAMCLLRNTRNRRS